MLSKVGEVYNEKILLKSLLLENEQHRLYACSCTDRFKPSRNRAWDHQAHLFSSLFV